MRIASVLGILFFVTSGRAQIESLLGLDMATLFDNAETIENAFGKSLTKKLMQIAQEVYAGTLTPQNAVTFFEELTREERDSAAQGIVALVQDLERLVSAPGTKDQIRMALQFAPIIMKQVINAMPEPITPAPTKKIVEQEDVTEPKKVVKIKPNETEFDDMNTEEIRVMLGNLMGTGKIPDEYLELMEQLVNLADEYNEDADTVEERQALDDKSTSKMSEIKDKLEAGEDRIAQAAGGQKVNENGRIKGESGINEDNKNEHEKDEF